RRPAPSSSVSPSIECPSPKKCPSSCVAMDSTSYLPDSPPGDTDQMKLEFRKMSDSRTSPVTASTLNVVAPSVRSRSGLDRKPITEALSMSKGAAVVNPPNVDDSCTLLRPVQRLNALV